MYMDYKLREIQDEINKIEDEDSSFTKNEKWIELRRQQDKLYKLKMEEMENEERGL